MSTNFRIERHGAVTSTNDIIRERIAQGEPAGLVVVAAEQTKGRGRLGRQWSSPVGNLYCSLLLAPGVPASEIPSLSLVIALALAEAIDGLASASSQAPNITLKWPNDVLIDGAKTAGILLEMEDGLVVAGIGVNLQNHPDGQRYPTTNLLAHGLLTSVDTLLAALLDQLNSRLVTWRAQGFAAIRPDWLALGPAIADIIYLRQEDAILQARFIDITATGALVVERQGKQEILHTAELVTVGTASR